MNSEEMSTQIQILEAKVASLREQLASQLLDECLAGTPFVKTSGLYLGMFDGVVCQVDHVDGEDIHWKTCAGDVITYMDGRIRLHNKMHIDKAIYITPLEAE